MKDSGWTEENEQTTIGMKKMNVGWEGEANDVWDGGKGIACYQRRGIVANTTTPKKKDKEGNHLFFL